MGLELEDNSSTESPVIRSPTSVSVEAQGGIERKRPNPPFVSRTPDNTDMPYLHILPATTSRHEPLLDPDVPEQVLTPINVVTKNEKRLAFRETEGQPF